MKVDNAIILAAGASSRFAPLSYEHHKAMTYVKGEILIERQIRQLKDTGISDIIVVTGYKNYEFEYLKSKFSVSLINNSEYLTRNNTSSIYACRDYLSSSYICSSDNYFTINPFLKEEDDSFYSVLYANGKTDEWCITEDESGYINSVTIGGENKYYMLGHVFWSSSFSSRFLDILLAEYKAKETYNMLWEELYIKHIDELKLKTKKFAQGDILEFDSLDDLRMFDKSYVKDTRSKILKNIAKKMEIKESEITGIEPIKTKTSVADGFTFKACGKKYAYSYARQEIWTF